MSQTTMELSVLESYRKLAKEVNQAYRARFPSKRDKDQAIDAAKRSLKDFETKTLKSISDKIRKWMIEGFDEETIDYTEFLGFYFKEKGLTTSQIRNFFGEVKKIQMKTQDYALQSKVLEFSELTALKLLLPKLAYNATRNKNTKDFKDVFTIAVKAVLEAEVDFKGKQSAFKKAIVQRFENFTNFFEAVLAYHRTYGGK